MQYKPNEKVMAEMGKELHPQAQLLLLVLWQYLKDLLQNFPRLKFDRFCFK